MRMMNTSSAGCARAAATAKVADPALRALLEAQHALEDQIAALKLRKELMEAAQYDQQMERLFTDLAVKARGIRDIEGKK